MIFDRSHAEAVGLKRGDCVLATRSWTLHAHFDFLESDALGLTHSLLRRAASREWSRLASALETDGARRVPSDRLAIHIGDGDDRVVKGCVHVHDAAKNVLANFLLA